MDAACLFPGEPSYGGQRGVRVSLRRPTLGRRDAGVGTRAPARLFLPLGNHFHLRSATTTPRDRVERELSNKLFPGPLSLSLSLRLSHLPVYPGLVPPLSGHVSQTASPSKKNTQRRGFPGDGGSLSTANAAAKEKPTALSQLPSWSDDSVDSSPV